MPSYDYNSYIKKLLKDEAMLGTEIVESLVKKFKKTPMHCRKILSRAKNEGIISSSEPLRFNNGGFGYAVDSSKDVFISLLKYKPRLEAVFDLMNKEEIVSEIDIIKMSGALNAKGTKYYDLEKLLNDLNFFNKIYHIKYFNTTFYSYQPISENKIKKYDEKNFEKKTNIRVLPLVLSYCRKMNLISEKPIYTAIDDIYNGALTRQNLVFDAFAYTNIGNPNKEKTICVFDIEISKKYTINQFKGFMYRFETLINSTKSFKQRVIPIIVVRKISPAFEKELKKYNKVIILDLVNIFGNKIDFFLKLLSLDSKNEINKLEMNTIKAIDILDQSDFADTLIRFLPFIFESLVNEILTLIISKQYQNISLNRKTIEVNGVKKQFDGYYEDDDSIYLIESKFHKKNKIKWESYKSNKKIENDCVKYFLVDKFNHIKAYLSASGSRKKVIMCFVSANGFWKDVKTNLELIDETIMSVEENIRICVEIKELINRAKELNIPIKEHEEWLKKYYIKNSRSDDID